MRLSIDYFSPRLFTVFWLATCVFFSSQASAQQCGGSENIVIPPPSIWGDLTPFSVAADRQSDQTGSWEHNLSHPLWIDTDYDAGFLLATGYHGWDFFDARTEAKRQDPERIYAMDGWRAKSFYSGFDPRGEPLGWDFNDPRILAPRSWISYGELDTSGRNGALKKHPASGKIYLASAAETGAWIWEFDPAAWAQNPGSQNKEGAAPKIIYALEGVEFVDLEFAVAENNRMYLYASAQNGTGVYVFDVDAAVQSPCLNDSQHDIFSGGARVSGSTCSSTIFKSRIAGASWFIDTIDKQGASPAYLIVSKNNSNNVLYSLQNGAAPASRGTVKVSSEGTRNVASVAIWRTGSSIGVATLGADHSSYNPHGLAIYDVTNCAAQGGCSTNAIRTKLYSNVKTQNAKENIAVSPTGGANVFLWTGAQTQCGLRSGRADKELLLDVTNLNNVTDIAPDITQNVGGRNVNFFDYYYPEGSAGFKGLRPMGASFSDDGFLFRAMAISIDSILVGDPSPSLTISGDSQTFHGDATSYTANFTNCTPSSSSGWVWDTDSSANAVTITNGTTRTASITWLDTNVVSDVVRVSHPSCFGAEGVINVQISDPTPQIIDVTLSAPGMADQLIAGDEVSPVFTLSQCSAATFSTNTIGRAPLTYSWEINPDGPTASGAAAVLEWSVGNVDGSDDQTLILGAQNSSGSDSFTATVDIQDLLPLGFLGSPIVSQVGNSGTISVDANAQGATSWFWEFKRVGQAYQPAGGNGLPTQDFVLQTGDWVVQVTISNCRTQTTQQLETGVITVVANPPVPRLEALNGTVAGDCFMTSSTCIVNTGQTVAFSSNQGTGDITSYRYDFDHTGFSTDTCQFGGPSSTPITSFTYNTSGAFKPCVEASGPGGTVAVLANQTIQASPGNPPSISVTCGPSSVNTGQTSFCSATASNCQASPSGWSWTAVGATGNSNSASIGLQWSTAGSKTVLASNSSCGSVSGSSRISVSTSGGGGGGGGGGLTAVVEVTPANPAVGQVVSLDGTGSTGGAVGHFWSVKKGNTIVASYSGATAEHTFTAPGEFKIELNVTSNLGCVSCYVSDSETVTVTGEAGLAANFTLTPSTPKQGQNVVLNGDLSTGDIVQYLWTVAPPVGAPEEFSGKSVLYPFELAGNYNITLQVNSEVDCATEECSHSITKNVSVIATAQLKAKIRILGNDPVLGKFFTLDASTSTGGPTSYLWEVDGQEVPGATLTLKFDQFGTVPVKLTVTKGEQSDSVTELIQILGDCDPTGDRLCLSDRRFKVEVDFTDFAGKDGVGRPFEKGTSDSGLFWFFQAANAELLVKVLDACDPFGYYWVAVAGTTNVAYELMVTDTFTGEEYPVSNPLGNPAPALLDNKAFACGGTASVTPSVSAWYYPAEEEVEELRVQDEEELLAEQQRLLAEGQAWASANAERLAREQALSSSDLLGVTEGVGTCVPDNETLCFQDGRFEVTVDYRDKTGASGPGIKGDFETPDSGVYYFFDKSNWEMLVKMVNGCGANGNYWVFAGATTDQEYTLTVRDTVAGTEREYFNPLGTRAAAITDNKAFPCQ